MSAAGSPPPQRHEGAVEASAPSAALSLHYELCTDADCPVAYAYRAPFPDAEHWHPRPHGPQRPDWERFGLVDADKPHTSAAQRYRDMSPAEQEAYVAESERRLEAMSDALDTSREWATIDETDNLPRYRRGRATEPPFNIRRKREPLRPPDAPRVGTTYRDWRDFTNRVARPWLDNDGDDPRVDAWYRVLMTEADPWYLACALVIADNRIRELEADAE